MLTATSRDSFISSSTIYKLAKAERFSTSSHEDKINPLLFSGKDSVQKVNKLLEVYRAEIKTTNEQLTQPSKQTPPDLKKVRGNNEIQRKLLSTWEDLQERLASHVKRATDEAKEDSYFNKKVALSEAEYQEKKSYHHYDIELVIYAMYSYRNSADSAFRVNKALLALLPYVQKMADFHNAKVEFENSQAKINKLQEQVNTKYEAQETDTAAIQVLGFMSNELLLAKAKLLLSELKLNKEIFDQRTAELATMEHDADELLKKDLITILTPTSVKTSLELTEPRFDFLKTKPVEENKKSPLPSAAVITQKLKENPPAIDLKTSETALLKKANRLQLNWDTLKSKLAEQQTQINDAVAKTGFQGLTKEEQQVLLEIKDETVPGNILQESIKTLRAKIDSSSKINDVQIHKKDLEKSLAQFEEFITKQNETLQTLDERLKPLYEKIEQYKPPVAQAPIVERNFKM